MTGCMDWQFGELPQRFQSGAIHGFPALVDEGASVGLRVFDAAETAALAQERGLIRLFRIAMSRELKYLRKNLPLNPSAELAYGKLALPNAKPGEKPVPRELRDDALDRIMAALYLDNQPDIRSAAAFESRLTEGRSEVVPVGNRIGQLLSEVLALHADLSKKLKSRPAGPATQDMQSQLNRLIHPGFVATTPYPALQEYPRYLKALQYRLEKSAQDPQRDLKQMAEVAGFWQNYWKLAETAKLNAERDKFRWMLEEFRVSIFAQALKTPYPISAKRMTEAWAEKIKV
jgi:ATP-dependent helicase HrpA